VPQFGVSLGEHQWPHAPDNVQRRLGRFAHQNLRSSPIVLRWPGDDLRKHHIYREQLLDSKVREGLISPIFDDIVSEGIFQTKQLGTIREMLGLITPPDGGEEEEEDEEEII
jgi:hypothetical protein